MSRVRTSDIRAELRPVANLLKLTYTASNETSFARYDRQCTRKYRGKWKSVGTVAEEKAIVRDDGSILRLLVVRSETAQAESATGLLWMHDGGFAYGVPEQESILVDMICGDGTCVAVLPDYTKSIEEPYPAALTDCYRVLLWMRDNAEDLGINRNQLFVGGSGAGGGLAAALSLRARDVRDVRIAFQMTVSPMLDDRMESESARENNSPVWDSKKNRNAWDLYLRNMEEEIPVYAAPGRETDLRGMPAACGLVGDLEPMKDETVLYFARMKKANVPVSLRVYHGCFHGFQVTAVNSNVAMNAQRYLVESFRYAQKHYFAHNDEPLARDDFDDTEMVSGEEADAAEPVPEEPAAEQLPEETDAATMPEERDAEPVPGEDEAPNPDDHGEAEPAPEDVGSEESEDGSPEESEDEEDTDLQDTEDSDINT